MSDTKERIKIRKGEGYSLFMMENCDMYRKSGIKTIGSVSLKGII